MSPQVQFKLISPFPLDGVHKFYHWAHGELTLVGDLDKKHFIQHFESILRNQDTLSWGILVDHELVGLIAFEACKWPADTKPTYLCATVGLDPKVRGNGMMRQIAPVCVDYGFRLHPQVNRYNCMIPEENKAERHLVEALGFRAEGTMREGITIHNKLQDLIIYGLTRKDFYNGLLQRSNNDNHLD